MDLVMLLLLAFYIAIAIGAFTTIRDALQRGSELDVSVEEDHERLQLRELTEQKAKVLQEIRSVELDRETDKISSPEADRARRLLEREAVRIMKELDHLRGDEVDREAADADLDAWLAESRAGSGVAGWSTAAKLRHGGREPISESHE